MIYLTLKNFCVVLLVGIMLFPVGIDQSFAQPNKVIVASFAPDHTIISLTGSAGTLTIPFSEIIPTVPGNNFNDFAISFSLGINTQLLSGDFTSFVGTSATTLATPASVLEVTSDTVVITTAFDSTDNDPLTFDYTVANSDGIPNSGVITITFADLIGNVMANPYTSTLDDLYGLPEIVLEIPPSDVATTLLAGTQIISSALDGITFSAIGTGNESGTLVVTDPTSSSNTILTYTPMPGFAGTEAFDYTVTYLGNSDTSQFLFVVPTLVCTSSLSGGVDFGELTVGTESSTSGIDISSTGNTPLQPMLKGENWKSVADSSVTMNVGQTKFSLTDTLPYAQKTAFTLDGDNAGEKLGDAGSVTAYLQLVIALHDDAFRGATTQTITVMADCSD